MNVVKRFCILILTLSFGFSIAVRAEPSDIFSDFYAEASAGFLLNIWEPGFGETLLGFETEGLFSKHYKAEFGYRNQSFFSYSEEGPVDESSPTQQEIFRTNSKTSSGIEKSRIDVFLRPISKWLNINNTFVNILMSARIVRTEELYFGTATAEIPFLYVPENSTVIQYIDGSYEAPDAISVLSQESLAFKTRFIDYEYTFATPNIVHCGSFFRTTINSSLQNGGCEQSQNAYSLFRFGFYETSWSRPATSPTFTTFDGFPVVFDTTFTSQGVVFAYEYTMSERRGFFNLKVRYGLINDIVSDFESAAATLSLFEYELDYIGVEMGVGSTKRWDKVLGFLSVDMGGDFIIDVREWTAIKTDDSGDVEDEFPIEKDILYKIFFRVGVSWP